MLARGLVALGDSITNGRGGVDAMGVPFRSWALWLAEALELPYTNLAADGATADGVLRDQVPRLRGPYDLGCVYVGANDARNIAWDPAAYQRDLRAIVAALREACERVLVLAPPRDLGRPPAAPKPADAAAMCRNVALAGGAQLCDLAAFGGRRHVLPDAVHPTSLGQLAIADAAAHALGAPVPPSSLADPPAGAARFELWWARQWVRDVVRRARERRALAS